MQLASPDPPPDMSTPHHPPYVRRVVLPSGKTIEVVYFEDLAPAPRAVSRPEAPAELHLCGGCGSDLVYPVEWEEAGPQHWQVTLRCPNCEWLGGGVYAQQTVERFDERLDTGTEALLDDLKRLVHANMEDEIDRFVGALNADQIFPEDF